MHKKPENLAHSRRGMRAAFCVFGFLALAALFSAEPALAQQAELQQFQQSTGLIDEPLPVVVARLIRAVLGVLGIIFTVIVIYGGFVWMTAAGKPEQIQKAKTILKNGVIGMIITLSSFSIASFIINALLGGGGPRAAITETVAPFVEPLAGSLGAGIVQDHFPGRNALDVPRNTKIFVTFKEPINPASIIDGWVDGLPSGDPGQSTALNTDSVKIYVTADGEGAALGSAEVKALMDETGTIFVFDPEDLMGDGLQDINYTVFLTPNIQREDGSAAFIGTNSDGYQWDFEIGTALDLTPPKIVSIFPSADSTNPKNMTVSITFNEAMDPVAGTGTFDADDPAPDFTNILTSIAGGAAVDGTYSISNGYRTIDLTTQDECAVDPCGNSVFCLPGDADIDILVKAAPLGEEPPQAQQSGVSFLGLVDAVGNSLDGNADGIAQGTAADDRPENPEIAGDDSFTWSFTTTDELDNRIPHIDRVTPGVGVGEVGPDIPVEMTFSMPMKASTLSTQNAQLWPDPYYTFWFNTRVTALSETAPETVAGPTDDVVATKLSIIHPTLVSTEAGGWDYRPLVNNDAKGANQFCMHPANGPISGTSGTITNRDESKPFICNGAESSSWCTTHCSGPNPSDPRCADVNINLPDTSTPGPFPEDL